MWNLLLHCGVHTTLCTAHCTRCTQDTMRFLICVYSVVCTVDPVLDTVSCMLYSTIMSGLGLRSAHKRRNKPLRQYYGVQKRSQGDPVLKEGSMSTICPSTYYKWQAYESDVPLSMANSQAPNACTPCC